MTAAVDERRGWVERAAATADEADVLATIDGWSLDDAERLWLLRLVAETPSGHVCVDEVDAAAFAAGVDEKAELFGASHRCKIVLSLEVDDAADGKPRSLSADTVAEQLLLNDEGREGSGFCHCRGSVVEFTIRVKDTGEPA